MAKRRVRFPVSNIDIKYIERQKEKEREKREREREKKKTSNTLLFHIVDSKTLPTWFSKLQPNISITEIS